MMYQTAPEDDYGECPSSRTDSSYGWGWPVGSIFGDFSIFSIFSIFRFLSLGKPFVMLKWLVELRNFQFAELQAIPGGCKIRHIGVGTNLIPVLKKSHF